MYLHIYLTTFNDESQLPQSDQKWQWVLSIYFLRMKSMISVVSKIIHLCHSCITTPQNLQA